MRNSLSFNLDTTFLALNGCLSSSLVFARRCKPGYYLLVLMMQKRKGRIINEMSHAFLDLQARHGRVRDDLVQAIGAVLALLRLSE